MSTLQLSISEIDVQDGEHLGPLLKRLAKTKQWKQEALATELGIQRTYLSRLLNDDKLSFSGDLILQLARATSIPAEIWSAIAGGTFTGSPTSTTPLKNASDCMQSFMDKGTSILVDHEIISAVNCGLLKVSPFSEENIQPASLDLTVGEVTVDPPNRAGEISGVSGRDPQIIGDELYLAHNQIAYVMSAEEIELNERIVGHLGPIMRYSLGGLFLNCGPQVDPGWKGRVVVAVANLGKVTRKLKRGEQFLTIEFQFLRSSPTKNKTNAEMSVVPQVNGGNLGPSLAQTLETLAGLAGIHPKNSGSISERTEELDVYIFGKKQEGSLRERVDKLAHELM